MEAANGHSRPPEMARSFRDWFDLAATHQPGLQREAVLAQLQASQPDLITQVQALLQHHDAAQARTGFLAALPALGGPPSANAVLAAGVRLGNWEIVRHIADGGMGQVYEARRADGQYEVRVAVKRLRPGTDSASVLERFALERQALARLDHPHIAALLDAGADPQGLPYFVMELVQGQSVVEAARGQSLAQRLKWLVQLAEAVAHAHSSLLLHRDLKPSNVLVDLAGRVKLLDFGIAKMLDEAEGAAAAALTRTGWRAMTPLYASPEQLRSEPLTPASDVYALGLLLHETLTGARPQASAAGAVRAQPLHPSAQVPGPGAVPQAQLRGDVDAIVAKATAPEAAQRYASAQALAEDLRAVIEQRPVAAGRFRPLHALRLTLQRHPLVALAAALGVVGLGAGLAAALLNARWALAAGGLGMGAGLALALFQTHRARQAREESERRSAHIRRLAREVVLEYGQALPHLPGGHGAKLRMLQRTAALLEELAHSPSQQSFAAEHNTGLDLDRASVQAQLAALYSEREYNAKVDLERAAIHGEAAANLFARVAQDQTLVMDEAACIEWAEALALRAEHAQRTAKDLDAAQHWLQQAHAVLQRAAAGTAGLAPAVGAQALLPGEPRGMSLPLRRAQARHASYRADVAFGWDVNHLNDADAALDAIAEQIAHCKACTDMPDAQAQDWYQLGSAHGRQALVLARLERFEQACTQAQLGLAQRKRAFTMQPHNASYQGAALADANLCAGLHLDLGQAEPALAISQWAWPLLEQLLQAEPTHAKWLTQRGSLAFHHGRALLAAGQAQQALAVLEHSQQWIQAELARSPGAQRLHRRALLTQTAQALALHASGAAAAKVDAAAASVQDRALAQLQEPNAARDDLLAAAQALAALAPACSPHMALAAAQAARNAYARAQVDKPLVGVHAQLAAKLAAQAAIDSQK